LLTPGVWLALDFLPRPATMTSLRHRAFEGQESLLGDGNSAAAPDLH
jgi:hypothetical protein